MKLRDLLKEEKDITPIKPHLALAKKYPQMKVIGLDSNLTFVRFYVKLQDSKWEPDNWQYDYNLQNGSWTVSQSKTTPIGRNSGRFYTDKDGKWVLNHMKKTIKMAIKAGL